MAVISVHLESTNSKANLQLLQQYLREINNLPHDNVVQFTVTSGKHGNILAQDATLFFADLVQIPPKRWELLRFEDLGLANVFKPLLDAFSTYTWPNLKYLHLEASAENPYQVCTETHLPNAPQLQHLALVCLIPVVFANPACSIHLNTLVSLELNNYTTCHDLLQVLKQASLLEKCIIRMHGSDMITTPAPEQIIGLASLRHLALISASNLSILHWLCTPNLTNLQVEMMEDLPLLPDVDASSGEQLYSFIRFSCYRVLTHLKLTRCTFDDQQLIQILSTTLALTDLEVWWGPTGSMIDDLAVNTPFHGVFPCPQASFEECGPCGGFQADLHIPTYAPHLQSMEIYVHPSCPQEQEELYVKLDNLFVQRRYAFQTQHCQAHSHLSGGDDPFVFGIEPLHRDNDRNHKAFEIDFDFE